MDIQTEKIELVERLLEIDDEGVLLEVKTVLESHDKDFWMELPDYVKEGIERSLEQARNGQVVPHDEVMKKYQKYLLG